MEPPERPEGRTFIIVTFAISAVLGVVVAYLGITGYLGGPIP